MKRLYTILFLAVLSCVHAQGLAGDYVGVNNPDDTLKLVANGDGYAGYLGTRFEAFRLEGFEVGGVVYGVIFFTEAGFAQDLGFVLTPMSTDADFELVTAYLDAEGNPDTDTAEAYIFRKTIIAATPQPLLSPVDSLTSRTVTADGGLPLDRRYAAGEIVSSPQTGASFVVPAEHVFGFHADLLEFTLLPEDELSLTVVSVVTGSSVDAYLREFAADLVADGLALSPVTEAVHTQRGFKQAFYMVDDARQDLIYLNLKVGTADTLIALTTFSFGRDLNALMGSSDAFLTKIDLGAPDLSGLAAQQQQLADLLLYSRQEEFSGGVTGTGSLNSSLTLDLCANGYYSFDDTAALSVSVDGASFFDKSGKAHEGNWKLGYDLAGQVILMQSADGQPYSMRLSAEGGQVFLDAQVVTVTKSERCP